MRPNLSLNLGVRWSILRRSKPSTTNSRSSTGCDRPLTGLKGAITHPKGIIGKRDLNNFQPRLDLSWNFRPKWVFRGSFGIMTSDKPARAASKNTAPRTTSISRPATRATGFYSRTARAPSSTRVNPDGTVPTRAPISQPQCHVARPEPAQSVHHELVGRFQFQVAPTWLATATYQGTAGVGLVRNWNINQIPLSIALGNDRALQDKVFAAQQNYLIYPQFGTVNYLSNFNHNTWHSGNFAIEKRYGRGSC